MLSPTSFFQKVAPYIKYIIFLGAVGGLLALWLVKSHQMNKLQAAMDLYKRQVSGQLTDKERELQSANTALGIAQSKFMTQESLAKSFEQEKIQQSAEFEKYKKKYKIELESYQKTIATLQQQINNGSTVVVVKPENNTARPDGLIDPKKDKITYSWKSNDNRFELNDQDIFTPNNEIFKLRQNFKIVGEVYRETAGFLKTQKLTLEEVIEDGKNADGSIKYRTVATAQVVDSKFNYSERAPDYWVYKKGVFVLRGVISASFGLAISGTDVSPRFLIGTGLSFLEYKGFGLAVQLFIDVNVIQNTGMGLTLLYRPTVKDTKLNFGIGLSAHTPFNAQIGRDWTVSANLVFFLW